MVAQRVSENLRLSRRELVGGGACDALDQFDPKPIQRVDFTLLATEPRSEETQGEGVEDPRALWRVVRTEAMGMMEAARSSGSLLPRNVEDGLRAYLRCGVPACVFARVCQAGGGAG